MSAAIFYPGFICGAYPAIVLAQRYPIERVIFGIVLLWGMLVIDGPLLRTKGSIMVQC